MKLDYRSIFVAPPKKTLVSVDLSQAETWVVAYLANEYNMKRVLNDPDGDIHLSTAGSAIFYPRTGCPHEWSKSQQICTQCNLAIGKDQRYIGKRYNHASSYRMGPDKAAEIINSDSDKPPYVTVTIRQSRAYTEAWHSFYNVKGWWREIEEQIDRGRTITTVYGRSRTFYGQRGDSLYREATAYEPQSTVADHFNGVICLELGVEGGLQSIYKRLIKPYFCGGKSCNHTECHKIINQSHDSCILELPSSSAKDIGLECMSLLLRPLVIKNETFTIPVDGKIGDRWEDDKMDKLAA